MLEAAIVFAIIGLIFVIMLVASRHNQPEQSTTLQERCQGHAKDTIEYLPVECYDYFKIQKEVQSGN